jgi:hypothetical protein
MFMVDAAAQNAYSLFQLQNKEKIDKKRGKLILFFIE